MPKAETAAKIRNEREQINLSNIEKKIKDEAGNLKLISPTLKGKIFFTEL